MAFGLHQQSWQKLPHLSTLKSKLSQKRLSEKLRVGAASSNKLNTRAAPFTVHYTMTALQLINCFA
jgi:hypothetical protein